MLVAWVRPDRISSPITRIAAPRVRIQRAQTNPAGDLRKIAEIQPQWLTSVHNIGLTAGASAPDYLVEDVVNYLKGFKANVKVWEPFATPEQLQKNFHVEALLPDQARHVQAELASGLGREPRQGGRRAGSRAPSRVPRRP